MSSQQTPTNQQPPQAQPTQHQIDYAKWLEEIRREDAKRAHDRNAEFAQFANSAAINNANLALRMALLINGGAAVALLTFVRDLSAAQKALIANTLLWFALGTVAAVVGLALSYFTNYSIAAIAGSRVEKWAHPYIDEGPLTPKWRQRAKRFHIAAIIVSFSTVLFFAIGVFEVRHALLTLH